MPERNSNRFTRQLSCDSALGYNLDRVTATGWYTSATSLLTSEEKRPSALVVPTHPFALIA